MGFSRAAFAAVSIICLFLPASTEAGLFGRKSLVAFRQSDYAGKKRCLSCILSHRGGAESEDDEAVNLDEDDEDEIEEEKVEAREILSSKLDSKLSSSAVKATTKAQVKKTAAAKKAVSAKLSSDSAAGKTVMKKKRTLGVGARVPYFVRACLNPFTVFAMTKAYFASLFNLDYIKKDQSQDLRSALEEKAKKSGGGAKGRRKMKPGQAKTLSDLPQLSQ